MLVVIELLVVLMMFAGLFRLILVYYILVGFGCCLRRSVCVAGCVH